jgi:hypothetical protein
MNLLKSGIVAAVTLEHEARIGYLEMVASARTIDLYMMHSGGRGEYVHIARVDGRRAVDHPYKYHYRCVSCRGLEGSQRWASGHLLNPCLPLMRPTTRRFEKDELPKDSLALLQLRLTPHYDTSQDLQLYKFSVMVGDVARSSSLPPSFMPRGKSAPR